jgi:predicted GNAT family acetyltransferase
MPVVLGTANKRELPVITDADIQAYIRSGVGRGRESERIGPFLATFTGHSDNPYLNYAIPDDGATPSPTDVAALVAAYRRRNRLPRLEYMASLSPAVEVALTGAGFAVEGRLPILVCTPDSARDLPVPAGIALIAPACDDDIRAMIAAQNEAYGEGRPGPEEVAARRANLAAGGLAVLARDATTGEPAGGATCDVPLHGVTELAGVGVRPAFRRRGIAGAMTARLVRDALARGVTTIFLTPAGEAEGVYTRAGFVRVSEQVHISLARP